MADLRLMRGKLERAVMRRIVRLIDRFAREDGNPIFESDWDLLIVLDGCRADGLKAVSSEFSFLPDHIPTIRSVASWTKAWMEHSFTPEYREQMQSTAFVTWNPYSDKLDPTDWYSLEEVWRGHSEVEFLAPRVITDKGIQIWREHNPDRMILHYKQPHAPYISLRDERESDELVFDLLRQGEITIERAWKHYLNNIRVALQGIELLRKNISADTTILTADHGEAFGEWRLFGHGEAMPVDPVMDVPWVSLETSDTGEYQPRNDHDVAEEAATDAVQTTREEQLKALGYR
jgi:hypothetical protein